MTGPTRLATYGTLGPGRANHHHLAMLKGQWSKGWVRGRLHNQGWGADQGFPGLVLDQAGDVVDVDVVTSEALPDHWARLDAFEGAEYQRVLAEVTTAEGGFEAFIYVLTDGSPISESSSTGV